MPTLATHPLNQVASGACLCCYAGYDRRLNERLTMRPGLEPAQRRARIRQPLRGPSQRPPSRFFSRLLGAIALRAIDPPGHKRFLLFVRFLL